MLVQTHIWRSDSWRSCRKNYRKEQSNVWFHTKKSQGLSISPYYCIRELAYLTLVRSGLEYASVVWDPFLQREIDRLKKIQRRAVHLATNNYRRECGLTSTQLIDSLGWDNSQERRKTDRPCMLYKAINREVALSTDMLCRPDRRTRAAHKLSEPFTPKPKRDHSQILPSLELYRIGIN